VTDLIQLIREAVHAESRQAFVRGTVTGTNGNRVLVQRQGAAAADPVGYPRLAGYSPAPGDEVLLVRAGGGYVVLGRVVR
jgi:hypothetical protein